jgi:hypothetical protein
MLENGVDDQDHDQAEQPDLERLRDPPRRGQAAEPSRSSSLRHHGPSHGNGTGAKLLP